MKTNLNSKTYLIVAQFRRLCEERRLIKDYQCCEELLIRLDLLDRRISRVLIGYKVIQGIKFKLKM